MHRAAHSSLAASCFLSFLPARFLIGVSLYLGIGILSSRDNPELSGIERIPHIDFWRTVPGLVQDGVKFTMERFTAFREARAAEGGGGGTGGLLGGHVDPDDIYAGKGAPTARSDDL
jgi:hypothetical protein